MISLMVGLFTAACGLLCIGVFCVGLVTILLKVFR